MDNEKRKKLLKARLIALAISLAMLAAALGVTFWQYGKMKAAYLPFDLTIALIINGVGFVFLYLIVVHFLKKNI